MDNNKSKLMALYTSWRGQEPVSTERLQGAGSNREYYRLTDDGGQSVIGVIGTSRDENHAFVYLARHFELRQLPVPRILATSDDELCYLQTDLGRTSLFDALSGGRQAGGRYNQREKQLLVSTIRQLPNIQLRGARGLDWTACYPQPEFDEEGVLFDLNYFKYCFLKLSATDFNEFKLEQEFQSLQADLLSEKYETFMYRDFQSRNVMIHDGEPFFIDFQGGRKGPFYYDLASFLWQASAHMPDKLRQHLADVYFNRLTEYAAIDHDHFCQRLQTFVMFRTLQVLGAYGFRGLWEKKKHFIDSIPDALSNLKGLIAQGTADKYPYLKNVLTSLIAKYSSEGHSIPERKPQSAIQKLIQNDKSYTKATTSPLVVRVFSFSYKKGIPEDTSGNGGGYVFDCRATHNPGRYEQYKSSTGLEQNVIEFLEEDGEILTFLQSVYKLADFHVKRFIERGFTNLMFSCGCTGGQHRSVYSAQHLAEHINGKFGVEVRVTHREQGIETILPAHEVI